MYILEIKVDCTDEKIISYYNDKSEKSITSQNCDSGVDIVTTEDVEITRNQIGVLNFNIKCQMININENDGTKKQVGYYLYPRSSISSTPLIMANSVGIIDSGYRGNIMAKVRYIPMSQRDGSYTVKSGTRLFQICAPDLSPVIVKVVDTLTETARGEGGFGSTGLDIC